MKIWAVVILVLAVIAAAGAATHFIFDAGKDSCQVSNLSNGLNAATGELAQAATFAKSDSSNAGHLAAHKDKITSTTTTLTEAIHAPEPKTAAPGAITRIPNPFPAGFSVCWNAASTRDPAAVAACEAHRGHGIPVSGQRGEYGYGQPAVHLAPAAGTKGPAVPGADRSGDGHAHPVPGRAPQGLGRAAEVHGGQGLPLYLDRYVALSCQTTVVTVGYPSI